MKDSKNGIYSFKLCDLQGTRGILWEHEMPLEEEYSKDRGFFHSFAGDVSRTVLAFKFTIEFQ